MPSHVPVLLESGNIVVHHFETDEEGRAVLGGEGEALLGMDGPDPERRGETGECQWNEVSERVENLVGGAAVSTYR